MDGGFASTFAKATSPGSQLLRQMNPQAPPRPFLRNHRQSGLTSWCCGCGGKHSGLETKTRCGSFSTTNLISMGSKRRDPSLDQQEINRDQDQQKSIHAEHDRCGESGDE